MNIISFAYTTPALLAGAKRVTRRDWKPEHAAKFRAGMRCLAYDKSPRIGGKSVAIIRLLKEPLFEPMVSTPDSDFEKEGFAWLVQNRPLVWRKFAGEVGELDPWAWFNAWRQIGGSRWVVRFELIDILATENL